MVHVSTAEFTVQILSSSYLNGDFVRRGCGYKNQDFIRAERQSGNDLSELTRGLNGLIFGPSFGLKKQKNM